MMLSKLCSHLAHRLDVQVHATPTAGDAVGASLRLSAGRVAGPDDIIHGVQFAAPGDVFGYKTDQETATATIHAALRHGVREFDTAPLYTDSEDKLGRALLTASPSTCGGASVKFLKDRLFVGGKEVKLITKTGRLVRKRIRNAPEGEPLGWRPAAPGE